MTEPLFATDPYRASSKATVVSVTPEGGLVLDRTVFYPRGGGQPGDSGRVTWASGKLDVASTVKGDTGEIILLPAAPVPLPEPGTEVEHHLDWERRLGHMRIHTALHLLSVVLPYPVTGGAIAADRGRLDFAIGALPEPQDVIAGRLNTFISRDLPVTEQWISEADLAANPGLVKTLSVAPPKGSGKIRLVKIGEGLDQVDLQPCGGTHVRSTAEIGKIAIAKVENKGKQNRRVVIEFA